MQTFCTNNYADIYIGCLNNTTKEIFSIELIEKICQEYVDKINLCVTVTPTKYIYTNGNEPGVIIGLINYPRFPVPYICLEKKAIKLANILKQKLNQRRVTIKTNMITIMIGSKNDN